jgi:hypothetical protein
MADLPNLPPSNEVARQIIVDALGPLWDGVRHFYMAMPGPDLWRIPEWKDTTEEQKFQFGGAITQQWSLVEIVVRLSDPSR